MECPLTHSMLLASPRRPPAVGPEDVRIQITVGLLPLLRCACCACCAYAVLCLLR